jgi:hypothetical protein
VNISSELRREELKTKENDFISSIASLPVYCYVCKLIEEEKFFLRGFSD